MAHSHTNLIYHVVFSTKNREPFVREDVGARLYAYVRTVVADRGGTVLAINGMPDHVHVLCKLGPNVALSDVIRDVKANSSRWLRRQFPDMRTFGWQTGYGAFTVSESQVGRVRAYVESQREHHSRMSYSDEMAALLRANRVAFDDGALE